MRCRRGNSSRAKRVRQHVNPFAGKLGTLKMLPEHLDWDKKLARPDLPFHVDLGCALGNYLFACAEHSPDVNFVGLEIRKQIVDIAAHRQARKAVDNLTFLHCNLIVPGALDAVLSSMRGNVRSVSIFHPDPNFKKRLKKRTVLTPTLADSLARGLPSGCHVYIQSDVEKLFLEMESVLSNSCDFEALPDEEIRQDFCSERENVMGIPTDREVSVLKRGLPVWRKNFKRA
eukprot:g4750.t1